MLDTELGVRNSKIKSTVPVVKEPSLEDSDNGATQGEHFEFRGGTWLFHLDNFSRVHSNSKCT